MAGPRDSYKELDFWHKAAYFHEGVAKKEFLENVDKLSEATPEEQDRRWERELDTEFVREADKAKWSGLAEDEVMTVRNLKNQFCQLVEADRAANRNNHLSQSVEDKCREDAQKMADRLQLRDKGDAIVRRRFNEAMTCLEQFFAKRVLKEGQTVQSICREARLLFGSKTDHTEGGLPHWGVYDELTMFRNNDHFLHGREFEVQNANSKGAWKKVKDALHEGAPLKSDGYFDPSKVREVIEFCCREGDKGPHLNRPCKEHRKNPPEDCRAYVFGRVSKVNDLQTYERSWKMYSSAVAPPPQNVTGTPWLPMPEHFLPLKDDKPFIEAYKRWAENWYKRGNAKEQCDTMEKHIGRFLGYNKGRGPGVREKERLLHANLASSSSAGSPGGASGAPRVPPSPRVSIAQRAETSFAAGKLPVGEAGVDGSEKLREVEGAIHILDAGPNSSLALNRYPGFLNMRNQLVAILVNSFAAVVSCDAKYTTVNGTECRKVTDTVSYAGAVGTPLRKALMSIRSGKLCTFVEEDKKKRVKEHSDGHFYYEFSVEPSPVTHRVKSFAVIYHAETEKLQIHYNRLCSWFPEVFAKVYDLLHEFVLLLEATPGHELPARFERLNELDKQDDLTEEEADLVEKEYKLFHGECGGRIDPLYDPPPRIVLDPLVTRVRRFRIEEGEILQSFKIGQEKKTLYKHFHFVWEVCIDKEWHPWLNGLHKIDAETGAWKEVLGTDSLLQSDPSTGDKRVRISPLVHMIAEGEFDVTQHKFSRKLLPPLFRSKD